MTIIKRPYIIAALLALLIALLATAVSADLEPRDKPADPPKVHRAGIFVIPCPDNRPDRYLPGIVDVTEGETGCYYIQISGQPKRAFHITPYVRNHQDHLVTFNPTSVRITPQNWWQWHKVSFTAAEDTDNRTNHVKIRHNVTDPNYRYGVDTVWQTKLRVNVTQRDPDGVILLTGCEDDTSTTCVDSLDDNAFAHKRRDYTIKAMAYRYSAGGKGFSVVTHEAVDTVLDDLTLVVDGRRFPVHQSPIASDGGGPCATCDIQRHITVTDPTKWEPDTVMDFQLLSDKGWLRSAARNSPVVLRIIDND